MELYTVSARGPTKEEFIKEIPVLSIVVISLAGTLDLTPPPVKYLIVKVVFDGDIP